MTRIGIVVDAADQYFCFLFSSSFPLSNARQMASFERWLSAV